MSWEDSDPNVRRRLRLALAGLLFVVVPVASFVGWNVYAIQRRSTLLDEVARYGVGYVSAAKRDADGSEGIGVAMVEADARRQLDPDSPIRSDRPAVHSISAFRGWLGDEAIAMILLTDAETLPTYRSAFPETWIIADPTLAEPGRNSP